MFKDDVAGGSAGLWAEGVCVPVTPRNQCASAPGRSRRASSPVLNPSSVHEFKTQHTRCYTSARRRRFLVHGLRLREGQFSDVLQIRSISGGQCAGPAPQSSHQVYLLPRPPAHLACLHCPAYVSAGLSSASSTPAPGREPQRRSLLRPPHLQQLQQVLACGRTPVTTAERMHEYSH